MQDRLVFGTVSMYVDFTIKYNHKEKTKDIRLLSFMIM